MSRELFKQLLLKKTDKGRLWFRDLLCVKKMTGWLVSSGIWYFRQTVCVLPFSALTHALAFSSKPEKKIPFKVRIFLTFSYAFPHPQDCPSDAGDFRAQQCSAHADVRFQGQYHEWLPVYNDPENPCALKCKTKDSDLVVELAPKVLDGTRCYTESLDMCISGACQVWVRIPELIFVSLDCTSILLFGNW